MCLLKCCMSSVSSDSSLTIQMFLYNSPLIHQAPSDFPSFLYHLTTPSPHTCCHFSCNLQITGPPRLPSTVSTHPHQPCRSFPPGLCQLIPCCFCYLDLFLGNLPACLFTRVPACLPAWPLISTQAFFNKSLKLSCCLACFLGVSPAPVTQHNSPDTILIQCWSSPLLLYQSIMFLNLYI